MPTFSTNQALVIGKRCSAGPAPGLKPSVPPTVFVKPLSHGTIFIGHMPRRHAIGHTDRIHTARLALYAARSAERPRRPPPRAQQIPWIADVDSLDG
jgi:hypothetical protein